MDNFNVSWLAIRFYTIRKAKLPLPSVVVPTVTALHSLLLLLLLFFQVLSKLGKGAQGTVHLVENKVSKEVSVVKKVCL